MPELILFYYLDALPLQLYIIMHVYTELIVTTHLILYRLILFIHILTTGSSKINPHTNYIRMKLAL